MFRANNILDPNQIVEPGASEKADFDRDAYHKAMREGRSEGVLRAVAIFLGCALFAFFVLVAFDPRVRILSGLILGAGVVLALSLRDARRKQEAEAEAIRLHQQAHALQAEAAQLEIEAAKSSGAFDRWDRA